MTAMSFYHSFQVPSYGRMSIRLVAKRETSAKQSRVVMIIAPPDLEVEKSRCREFIQNYRSADDQLCYKNQLQTIANRECQTLIIHLDDVAKFFDQEDSSFIHRIQLNAKRYVKIFCEAADESMPEPTRTDLAWDLLDEFTSQAQERVLERKKARLQISLANPTPKLHIHPDLMEEKPESDLPAALTRRYELQLTPTSAMTALRLRDIDASHVGHLVRIAGVVAQVSEVRPLVRVATYVDLQTGMDYYQEVVGKTFVPLHQAPKRQDEPNLSSRLEFLKDHSKFVSYQEVKIQENQDEVPDGTTPRSLKFTVTGSLTRRVKPGDQVIMSGICIAQPFAGDSNSRPGLLTSAYVETTDIQVQKLSYASVEISDEDLQMIKEVSANGNVYTRLAESIAPEIHGHVDVKKALLLMMVSGVTKETDDGMKLRGDIHVCLMGDPGVAKSQLLKFIANVSPRSVYTTGKGSSGVGLTASVVRDEAEGETCLEGGAMVLADRGVCCIDEFDKMDESDRTTIHEVMEQQTVSIAKAGITTTLNARTTILAAANPAWGRYNTAKTPSENIALPHALLSRFDLMWLIVDKVDAAKDSDLSAHVLHVHQHGSAPQISGRQHLTAKQLRSYITAARAFSPILPQSLISYISDVYSNMREENVDHKKAHTYTTPRTLMSIVRLSQAVAKLQFRKTVTQDDVEEALRLMRMSKSSLFEDDNRGIRQDPISAIYSKMNAYWKSSHDAKRHGITFGRIRELCAGLDFGSKNEKIQECIEEYSALGIIAVKHGDDGEPIVYFV